MSVAKKRRKYIKQGFEKANKKMGISFLRFFFNCTSQQTGVETTFFIELETVNAALSPSEVVLGFTPRINNNLEDLQYALAGTKSVQSIQSETIMTPSYVVMRVGCLGKNPSQICSYHSMNELKVLKKPFEIQLGSCLISENRLSGFVNVEADEAYNHPELLSNAGFAKWNLQYEIKKTEFDCYKNKAQNWSPLGLKTIFAGSLIYNDEEFVVNPLKSHGYLEKHYYCDLPETWFHISSSNLTSSISGLALQNSNFVLQGIYGDKVSCVFDIEDKKIVFNTESLKKAKSSVWNCLQSPLEEGETEEDAKLHYSVSFNSKEWVIDVDIYCKVVDLYNRQLELASGKRNVLNVVQSAFGIGEIKIYKKNKNNLEQIEFIKSEKTVCEFGQKETGEV